MRGAGAVLCERDLKEAIRRRYGRLAGQEGVGCGQPVSHAALRPGEVVLDLGCGAGGDCQLAAAGLGQMGRVIGLDMTWEMVQRAAARARQQGLPFLAWCLGEMEAIPLRSGSVDVVISNCVINLSLHKERVFQESLRVLKGGGRLVYADLVVEQELPAELREDLLLWVACLGGALPEEGHLRQMDQAGFEKVEVLSKAPLKGFRHLAGAASVVVRGFKGICNGS